VLGESAAQRLGQPRDLLHPPARARQPHGAHHLGLTDIRCCDRSMISGSSDSTCIALASARLRTNQRRPRTIFSPERLPPAGTIQEFRANVAGCGTSIRPCRLGGTQALLSACR
jgi:hypothetical protein